MIKEVIQPYKDQTFYFDEIKEMIQLSALNLIYKFPHILWNTRINNVDYILNINHGTFMNPYTENINFGRSVRDWWGGTMSGNTFAFTYLVLTPEWFSPSFSSINYPGKYALINFEPNYDGGETYEFIFTIALVQEYYQGEVVE